MRCYPNHGAFDVASPNIFFTLRIAEAMMPQPQPQPPPSSSASPSNSMLGLMANLPEGNPAAVVLCSAASFFVKSSLGTSGVNCLLVTICVRGADMPWHSVNLICKLRYWFFPALGGPSRPGRLVACASICASRWPVQANGGHPERGLLQWPV